MGLDSAASPSAGGSDQATPTGIQHPSLDADALSSAAASEDNKPSWISPWTSAISKPTWLFVLFAAACPLVGAFFIYIRDGVAALFLGIGLVCLLPLFCFFLWAAFRRRWRAAAIFLGAIVWMQFGYPIFGTKEPLKWISVIGFRIHIAPQERYLAGCDLHDFVEGGKKQKIGVCELRGPDEVDSRVFYDSSRQFDLPPSRRTEAWKQAMLRAAQTDFVAPETIHTFHIFGSFYAVTFY